MVKKINDLISFRKELHKYPELSQNESETQKRIINFLNHKQINASVIGYTGVIVVFDSGKDGKTILFRSDHDALPIQEINNFSYKSTIKGVSHKCGHDGHTAIMCGVAEYFEENPIKKGKLILLFQPAEENGEGAKAVLADDRFTFKPDYVFALHNLPGYPLHTVVYKEGSFTPSVKSIIVKLNGKTSHAAEPEMGYNPALAITEIINYFNETSRPDINQDDFILTTPIFIKMGEKSYGVSAGYGEVHYTIRSWSTEVMNEYESSLSSQISQIAENHHLTPDISWTEEFDSNENDPSAVDMIKKAIKINRLESKERERPFKWGEDFGLFTQRFPGAMFGIGSGMDCPALHNPDYDFPDEIVETGVKMFTKIGEIILNE